MSEQAKINKIKEAVKEFFEKMTIPVSSMEANLSSVKKETQGGQDLGEGNIEVINLNIKLDEPQILIGQQGQTLFEIQRLLRAILSRKLQRVFYLNLDINDYKKQKIEYLKNMAKDLADHVSLNKEEKSLPPMSSYERRIIHSELSQRTDVSTESQGEGFDRHIVIRAK